MQPLYDWAIPQTLRAHRETLLRLGAIYKRLNASFGRFAIDTLKVSTKALKSGSAANDSTYTQIEAQIGILTTQRDALASQMKALLNDATFGGHAANEQQAKQLIAQGEQLLEQAKDLADR